MFKKENASQKAAEHAIAVAMDAISQDIKRCSNSAINKEYAETMLLLAEAFSAVHEWRG